MIGNNTNDKNDILQSKTHLIKVSLSFPCFRKEIFLIYALDQRTN
jgi:hypothetical protein